MERTTIMLPPELKTRAVRRARRKGISFGEYVREALTAELSREGGKGVDSFLSDTAVYRGEAPSDLSARHDDYLYGELD